jgi:ParB family chromosome partitioning protein
MQIPIQDIQVKNRIRKNLGDLSGLKESIHRHGILNPIVINGKNELVAGHRRLESARQLGWTLVPVRIVDEEDPAQKLEMEIDENLYRKNLSADELADAYEQLEKMRNPGWLRKLWQTIQAFFRKLFKRSRA